MPTIPLLTNPAQAVNPTETPGRTRLSLADLATWIHAPPCPEAMDGGRDNARNWEKLRMAFLNMDHVHTALGLRFYTATARWNPVPTLATVAATDNGSGDVLAVRLLAARGMDPNVQIGDVFPYFFDDNGLPYGLMHLDSKLKSVEVWNGDSGAIKGGWARADGTANSSGNGGSGIDLTKGGLHFVRSSNISGALFGAEPTSSVADHSHTGSTSSDGAHDHGGTCVAGGHHHEICVVSECFEVCSGGSEIITFEPPLDHMSPDQIATDTVAGHCHAIVVQAAHSHTISDDGAHQHAAGLPQSLSVHWIERVY